MTIATDLGSFADTITKTVIALLTLIAVAVVALGLGRAWLGRRKPQVVIYDIEPMDGLPTSVVAGLSPQFRQAVRRSLTSQSDVASHAHLTTLVEDVSAGLLVTSRATTLGSVEAELQADLQDVLGALSAGVRALAPDTADGLVALLGTALPAQRGWVVRTSPALRTVDRRSEVGVNLEFAELGRAPDAVTTFWTATGGLNVRSDDAQLAAGVRSALHELLEPAAQWIAIRLVARQVAQTPTSALRRLRLRGRDDRDLSGVRSQLAGQMSLYAIRESKFGAGFADQALEDLHTARRLLPDYFRPHAAEGNVLERVGWLHRQAHREELAHATYFRAVAAYDVAEQLISKATQSPTAQKERDAVVDRRTKCRLMCNDPAQRVIAENELRKWIEPVGAPVEFLYNSACLYAVAISGAEPVEAALFTQRAWELLGRTLVMAGTARPWTRVLTDGDLVNLRRDLRERFCNALRATVPPSATREEALALTAAAMAAAGIVPDGSTS